MLGPLEVRDGAGTDVPVVGARVRAVLATLLVRAGSPVPLDVLADLVWDGAPPAGYAATLRSHVRRLRAIGGPGLSGRISARGSGYVIEVDPSELDVLRFEELARRAEVAAGEGVWDEAGHCAQEALGLWRDEPLADISSERLLDQVVPRLVELRARLLEFWAQAELRDGRFEQLVPRLRELVGEYPLRERFHELLMLALTGSGRQAEALSAYRDARRVLVEELGAEPGTELRRLHGQLLAGDRGPGWSEPSPRQLPAAASFFTGRKAELARLRAALPGGDGGGALVISAVDGMGGVGKTALAVRLAHDVADRFPDGQLFIDLHGHTAGAAPRPAGEALALLLRALGVPSQRIPEGLEERSGLYRQCLAGTRTLVVLDNAADEAQVRALLPGTGGCTVVVTSRRRLKGLDDAHGLSLDLLPRAEALALLVAVAGRGRVAPDDPLADEVVRLCGHLPLALRIAGALLRHRPAWSLEYLVGLLADQDSRIASLSDGERDLAGILDLSYTGLPERQRVLLRRLGLAPGPEADAYSAAALLETGSLEAARLLEDLLDHHLLIEHSPGRYRMHDLIRARARALAVADPQNERADALGRLLRYYSHTAQFASVPVARHSRPAPPRPAPADAPALPERDAALAWLRTERENLEAAYHYALENDMPVHVLALAGGLGELLRSDGPHQRALEVQRAAAEIAERHAGPAALSSALAAFGIAQRLNGDARGAEASLTRAADLARATNDHTGEAYARTELAVIRRVAGYFAEAEAATSRALELYRMLGDRGGQASALADFGMLRHITRKFTESEAALLEALQIYRTIDHQPGIASTLNALGLMWIDTDEPARAEVAIAEALDLHRATGYRDGEANALANLGFARILIGDLAGAEGALNQALEIHSKTGHQLSKAVALHRLGYVYLLRGDPVAAERELNQGIEIYRAVGHRDGESDALIRLAAVRKMIGDFPGAHRHVREALEIILEAGDRFYEVLALCLQADITCAENNPAQALALYRKALALSRRHGVRVYEATCLEGLGDVRLATGHSALAASHLHHSLGLYDRSGRILDIKRVRAKLEAEQIHGDRP